MKKSWYILGLVSLLSLFVLRKRNKDKPAPPLERKPASLMEAQEYMRKNPMLRPFYISPNRHCIVQTWGESEDGSVLYSPYWVTEEAWQELKKTLPEYTGDEGVYYMI